MRFARGFLDSFLFPLFLPDVLLPCRVIVAKTDDAHSYCLEIKIQGEVGLLIASLDYPLGILEHELAILLEWHRALPSPRCDPHCHYFLLVCCCCAVSGVEPESLLHDCEPATAIPTYLPQRGEECPCYLIGVAPSFARSANCSAFKPDASTAGVAAGVAGVRFPAR